MLGSAHRKGIKLSKQNKLGEIWFYCRENSDSV